MLLPVYGKLFTKLHRPIFALINFLFSYPDNNYISNKLTNPSFCVSRHFPSGYSHLHSIDTISQQLYSNFYNLFSAQDRYYVYAACERKRKYRKKNDHFPLGKTKANRAINSRSKIVVCLYVLQHYMDIISLITSICVTY